MTHRLATNYAKNYCNRTLIVKVIVENVVTCFFGTRCSMQKHDSQIAMVSHSRLPKFDVTSSNSFEDMFDRMPIIVGSRNLGHAHF